MSKASLKSHFIAQELILGIPASVSLLSTGNDVLPISLNKQNLTLSTPEGSSSYRGGFVPLSSKLEAQAFEVAKKLVSSFSCLKGFVGVDLVLTDKGPVVIELNPRLAASYVGIRQVLNLNLAQGMIDAVLRSELPDKVLSFGLAYFSKVETAKLSDEGLRRTYAMRECVSPPFPVSRVRGVALVSTFGRSLEEAEARFLEAKEHLLNIT